MILTERYVRKEKEITKPRPEAFLPFKHVELSVIRHRDLNEDDLCKIGRQVATECNKPLIGHGDFLARDARAQNLNVVPAEGLGMPPNHADVVGWPPEKPAQMLRAVEIAAVATFVAAPPMTN